MILRVEYRRFIHREILICLYCFLFFQKEVKMEDQACPSSAHIGPFGLCSVLVEKNETVLLKCTFDTAVNCAWTRRGFHVDITMRYSYVNDQHGLNVTDCTIQINGFKPIDAGEWICKSLADSSNKAIVGAKLSLAHLVTIVENPENIVPATVNDIIKLNCKFDTHVHCAWYHNDNKIICDDRHNYDDKNSTKNCKLKIHGFGNKDVGKWKCSNIGNETQPSINSTETEISAMTEPTNPSIYLSHNRTEGAIICITEGGNPIPTLHWEVDDKDVPVKDNRVTRQLHSHSYDSKIILKYDYIIKLNTSLTLTCVATQNATETKDHIKIDKIASFLAINSNKPSAAEIRCSGINAKSVLVAICFLLVLQHNCR